MKRQLFQLKILHFTRCDGHSSDSRGSCDCFSCFPLSFSLICSFRHSSYPGYCGLSIIPANDSCIRLSPRFGFPASVHLNLVLGVSVVGCRYHSSTAAVAHSSSCVCSLSNKASSLLIHHHHHEQGWWRRFSSCFYSIGSRKLLNLLSPPLIHSLCQYIESNPFVFTAVAASLQPARH